MNIPELDKYEPSFFIKLENDVVIRVPLSTGKPDILNSKKISNEELFDLQKSLMRIYVKYNGEFHTVAEGMAYGILKTIEGAELLDYMSKGNKNGNKERDI